MKILVACEESQAVTKELRRLGHEAYSCDVQECSGGHPEWHIMDDVLSLINGHNVNHAPFPLLKTSDGRYHDLPRRWDMIIAFPPCTFISNAGNRWLHEGGQLNRERYEKGLAAKEFFMKILTADCPKIAVENPMHAGIFDMPPYSQEIQPFMFGHPYTKKTRLWLKNLPILMATDIVPWERTWCPSSRSDNTGAAKHNGKARSKTFPGVAKAMAEQWAGPAGPEKRYQHEQNEH